MHYIAEIERRVDANMIRTDYRQLVRTQKDRERQIVIPYLFIYKMTIISYLLLQYFELSTRCEVLS